jgi:hypothetical protein
MAPANGHDLLRPWQAGAHDARERRDRVADTFFALGRSLPSSFAIPGLARMTSWSISAPGPDA